MKSKSVSPGSSKWKCSHCEKVFKYNSERIRHEQSHVPQFECKVCAKKFTFVSALKRHEKQHERTGNVSCELCKRKFKDNILLKRHMQYAHDGTYICQKCKATFHSDSALRTHMKVHKPESERRFHCSYGGCTKSFNFSHHLKHHELTHTNSKQYYCKICGIGFIQSYHMKIHQKTHEPESWLTCTEPGCNKRFASDYARRRHYNYSHRKQDVSSDLADSGSKVLSNPSKDECSSIKKLKSKKKSERRKIELESNGENVEENVPSILQHEGEVEQDNVSNFESLPTNDEIKPTKAGHDDDKIEGLVKNPDGTDKVSLDKEDNSIRTCKYILGCCIVTGSSEISDNCLCAQMITNEDEYNDLIVPNENHHISNKDYNHDPKDNMATYINSNLNYSNASKNNRTKEYVEPKCTEVDESKCEGCECAKTCPISPFNKVKQIENQMPKIEYRNDGTIMIEETFDIEIKEEIESYGNRNTKTSATIDETREFEFLPSSSCKDVIGNCIENNNGTNDGCLCDKMNL